ncbi:nucleolar MIF4G domain-containing protein 1 [Anabrus simplex]|uniref:nucleolar MIF4G domain-containing protein 1 n=1 Tax=Anabrus simplex TaxID=316456 RepID=UPI0035A36495
MTVPGKKRRMNGRNKVDQRAVKTRKEIRKEKRKQKGVRKHEFFSRKKNAGGKIGKQALNKPSDLNRHSGTSEPRLTGDAILNQRKSSDGFIKHQLREKEKERLRREKLEKEMQKTRKIQMKQANREEDKIIKKLEKQLKLNKRKSKSVPKSFASDGLDYLLEICDEDKIKQAMLLEQTLHESGSEFEEDFAMVTGRGKKPKVTKRGKGDDNGDENDDSVIGGDSDSEISTNGDDNSVIGDGSHSDVINSDGEEQEDDDNDSISGNELSDENDGSEDDYETDEVDGGAMMEHHSKSPQQRTNNVASSQNKSNSKVGKTDKTNDTVRKKRKREDSCGSDVSEQNSPLVVRKPKSECKKDRSSEKEVSSVSNAENLHSEGGLYVKLRHEMGKSKHKKMKGSEPEQSAVSYNSDDDDIDDCGDDSVEGEEGASDKGSENNEFWEDIYGRTRDKKGNVVQVSAGKYIPPQLRAQAASADAKKKEQLQRLRKQMKGLLNRLAENNMNSIAMQLDELYMTNSRNDMNDTLTVLMCESLIAPVLTPERLIMEHCMLIAILHANVGTEVGAHFLQAIVKRFDELHSEECEVENKQLDNVILVISHLYNFKVFNSLLMYNILDKLAEAFGPKEVELILLVLRSVGFSLRKDDPIALKALVLQLQQKASKASQSQNDSRVQFMLDILMAIKNNNMAKIPNYDTSHSEHLKKLLKGFLRKGNYVTELKISLEDLLKAEERGRWWVVGSAWSGVLPGESQSEQKGEMKSRTPSQSQNYSQQLLDLARKQRMNTDVRRNIFCILMTAEDYLDAFEKLLHLGLKNQQEREIIHVILDCCLHEKEFNPYYGHLTQKFCDFDRKYQMILQYSLWDKFKEVQNLTSVQIRNLAQLLVLLFIEKGLPLSILKVIHFTEVDKAMVRLLRQILLGILLHDSLEVMQEVFQRVAIAPKLHMFRESIRLFIQHFLLRKTDSLPEEDMKTLKDRANIVDTILSMAESRSRLF